MANKVLIFGLGKMGRVHVKYLEKNNVEWQGYDPYVKTKKNKFKGDILKLDEHKFSHVIIATPETTHYDIYKRIKEGFSGLILIEKPVVLSNENKDIFDDDKVYCGMVERFNPAVQALKEKFNPDLVVNIDFTRCSAAPLVSTATIFEDLGIHDLDLFTHLFGKGDYEFNLNICSKTYCLTITDATKVARFIWSKETYFKERKVVVRQLDCTYMVGLQEQTLTKHYLDEKGRSIVENIYVEKSSPVENELKNFLECKGRVNAKDSHKLMFSILSYY